jgi:very-short-patch-repair endonuclease
MKSNAKSKPPRPDKSGHPSLRRRGAVEFKQITGSPLLQGGVPEGGGGSLYKPISNLPDLKSFRRELRSKLTPAEATLWSLLKGRQVGGRKFRRQYSIGCYIIDFFCPEEKLGIELDGEVHMNTIAMDRDREREIFLTHTGIKILRFENKQVFEMPESLLREIESNFGWHK